VRRNKNPIINTKYPTQYGETLIEKTQKNRIHSIEVLVKKKRRITEEGRRGERARKGTARRVRTVAATEGVRTERKRNARGHSDKRKKMKRRD